MQRHAAFAISNSAAGNRCILPFGISHVFVYEDNYAGQTSIRVHRRVMDLRADLDKGAAGNTLAVLSRRIRAKACVKTRSTACPHSACPAEKNIASEAAEHFYRFSLLFGGAGHIASAQPTYRFCAEVMFAYRIIIYVRSVVLSVCFFAAAKHIGVQRHAVRAKISRPEQGRISSLIAHCALAQDIIHTLYASYFLNGHSSAPSDSRCLISNKKGFAPNSSLSRAPS